MRVTLNSQKNRNYKETDASKQKLTVKFNNDEERRFGKFNIHMAHWKQEKQQIT